MALHLDAQRDELLKRLLKRAETENRKDDNAETISARLQVFDSQTAPVLDYYREQGILQRIDGMGSADEVFQRIQACIDSRRELPTDMRSRLVRRDRIHAVCEANQPMKRVTTSR